MRILNARVLFNLRDVASAGAVCASVLSKFIIPLCYFRRKRERRGIWEYIYIYINEVNNTIVLQLRSLGLVVSRD